MTHLGSYLTSIADSNISDMSPNRQRDMVSEMKSDQKRWIVSDFSLQCLIAVQHSGVCVIVLIVLCVLFIHFRIYLPIFFFNVHYSFYCIT